MQVILTKEDIIDEIKKNFTDDVDFLYSIIDKGTNSWETYSEITNKLLKNLKDNEELAESTIEIIKNK